MGTPFTWNQMRGMTMVDGKLNATYPKLQPSYQCIVDGRLIENGLCKDGGGGYGCPCPDMRRDDPRVKAGFPKEWLPMNDPRDVARTILYLASDAAVAANISGQTYIVDNKSGGIRDCPQNEAPQC